MNLDNARTIRGWMSTRDLRWIANRAADAKIIVEVGIWLGRSTMAWCDNTAGHVFAVDHWQGVKGRKRMRPLHVSDQRQQHILEAKQNLVAPVEAGRLTVLSLPSVEAAHLIEPFLEWRGGADIVFLDGSHEHEDICADINAWLDRVRPGGLLCGHDRKWKDVALALNEMLPGWKPATSNIWQFSK